MTHFQDLKLASLFINVSPVCSLYIQSKTSSSKFTINFSILSYTQLVCLGDVILMDGTS